MQHSARLRYVDADEVGSEVVDFDGLKVRTPAGDKLGEVDGFIIDPSAQRAYYVVVDSGGWFRSRQFLVPIGHARMDDDGDALVLDVTREAISDYPEFNRDSFDRLNDDELREYRERFDVACCPERVGPEDHYAQPTWWRSEYYNWDVPAAVGAVGGVAVEPEPVGTRGTGAGDVSPHASERAQPGDVLGVKTGGERTGLGDTAEDEDDRRRDAERAAGKDIKDEERNRHRD
jgi:hypothetical protein